MNSAIVQSDSRPDAECRSFGEPRPKVKNFIKTRHKIDVFTTRNGESIIKSVTYKIYKAKIKRNNFAKIGHFFVKILAICLVSSHFEAIFALFYFFRFCIAYAAVAPAAAASGSVK